MLLKLGYDGAMLKFQGDEEFGEFEVLFNGVLIVFGGGDEFIELLLGPLAEPTGFL